MPSNVPERCSRCILPLNLPGVTADETGTCTYCRSFESQHRPLTEEATQTLKARFERLIGKLKGRGQYDCLVPVSGGKDSMFALYVAAGMYGLKTLAFNMNNGFQSPVAARNIERAVERLGVDLVVLRPSPKVMATLFRTFLTRAGEFCSPCNILIGAAARRVAYEHRIPLGLSGNARRWSAGIRGMSVSQHFSRAYYLNVVKGCTDLPGLAPYLPESPRQTDWRRLRGQKVLAVRVLEYINPMKDELAATLGRELGWEPPSEELEHGDCLLNPLKDHIVCRRWGVSETTAGYSAMVRNGKMTREEALREAEEEEMREAPAILEPFLDHIGMSRAAFEQAIAERHFTDYSNVDTSLYARASSAVWRAIGGARGALAAVYHRFR